MGIVNDDLCAGDKRRRVLWDTRDNHTLITDRNYNILSALRLPFG